MTAEMYEDATASPTAPHALGAVPGLVGLPASVLAAAEHIGRGTYVEPDPTDEAFRAALVRAAWFAATVPLHVMGHQFGPYFESWARTGIEQSAYRLLAESCKRDTDGCTLLGRIENLQEATLAVEGVRESDSCSDDCERRRQTRRVGLGCATCLGRAQEALDARLDELIAHLRDTTGGAQ